MQQTKKRNALPSPSLSLRRDESALAHHPPMLAHVLSAAINGIEALPVEVEVNCGRGDTLIVIVGLPDTALRP